MGFAAADGPRLGVLPLSPAALGLAIAAGLAVFGLWRAGAALLPVSLLGILLLPWLPFAVPPAFLLWVWPVAGVTWVAVAVLMVLSLPWRRQVSMGLPAAALGALLIFSFAAWRTAPMTPGGDEPHYLIITQSLLLDRSLNIENVHRRGDYRAYYVGDLAPHVQRRGRDGEIYSVHAPGLPVLITPAFALGGYPAVVAFMVLLATASSALAWHLGRLVTGQVGAAWFGWAVATLPVSAISHSFAVYPDAPAGLLALTGLWALVRAAQESRSGAMGVTPWLLHGAALALLPWLHSRFAVLAGGFGALILLRLAATKNPAGKAAAFLSVPAISAVLWVGFFMALYGTPDPTAPYGPGESGALRFVPGGLGGLLFDQRFGLLTYAPVVGCAFAGIGIMLAGRTHRRVALELLFVTTPYLLAVTHFPMWWGGASAPARFFVPVLALLAVPAAIGWTAFTSRWSRTLAGAALVLTGVASATVVWVERGRLAFNAREGLSQWLEWAGRLVDLTAAAPLWARNADLPLFLAIAVWLIVVGIVAIVLRTIDRSGRLQAPAAFGTATAAALMLAVLGGTSAVWALNPAPDKAVLPSQLYLLDTIASSPRALAVQVEGWSRVPARELPRRLNLTLARDPGQRPTGRETPPLFAVPPLPAGEYRVSVTAGAPGGWVMLGIARDQFALTTLQLPAEPITFRFPLPVRGLLIRGDEEARHTVERVNIEPLRVLRPFERLTGDMGRRAVRYGGTIVYFLDERTYPEPGGFWVGGMRDTAVVLQPDTARTSVAVRVRNAPVDNEVTLEAAGVSQTVRLAPGEEQQIEIPVDRSRGGAVLRVKTTAGFRPSEHEESSRDHRFLGVWVHVPD